MKKNLMCGLVGLLLIATILTGCTMSGLKSDKSDKADKDKKKTQVTAGEVVKSPLKIALVTGPMGIDDGSSNKSNYNGIQTFIQKNPESTVATVTLETEGSEEAVRKITEVIGDFDIIVCAGKQFTGIGEIAKEHKEVDFILVDAYPEAAGVVKDTCDNVYAMKFAEQESGFCAGIAAALETKSGKVSVVSGITNASNINYQRGFYAGVDYADKHYETKTELVELSEHAGKDEGHKSIGGNYVGSCTDIEKGKTIGKALIEKGVDVIFVAAGRSGEGVFTAVKEAVDKPDIKVIGCDVDQYDDGATPEGNIVLTSALKVVDANVTEQLNNIKYGTFEGGNVLLKADSYSTGYVRDRGRQQLKDESLKQIDDAFELVKDGTIEIPAK